jgi:hypothetical protein
MKGIHPSASSFAHTHKLSPERRQGHIHPNALSHSTRKLSEIADPRSCSVTPKRVPNLQRTASMPIFAASPSREDLDAMQSDMESYCTSCINQAIEEQNESIDFSCLSLLSIPPDIENLKFIPLAKTKLHPLDPVASQPLAPRLQVYLQGNNLTDVDKRLFKVPTIKILSLSNVVGECFSLSE